MPRWEKIKIRHLIVFARIVYLAYDMNRIILLRRQVPQIIQYIIFPAANDEEMGPGKTRMDDRPNLLCRINPLVINHTSAKKNNHGLGRKTIFSPQRKLLRCGWDGEPRRRNSLPENRNLIRRDSPLLQKAMPYLLRQCQVMITHGENTHSPILSALKNFIVPCERKRHRLVEQLGNEYCPNCKLRRSKDIKRIDITMRRQKTENNLQPTRRLMQADKINSVDIFSRFCEKISLFCHDRHMMP